jgi:hypothetical protein
MDLAALQEKADRLARGIGRAEGYGPAGNLPTRINNPGDMELGDRGWGTEAAKTVYPKSNWDADLADKTDGCSALRRECMAILSGASHNFEKTWTILELAQEWTGGDNPTAWASIVATELGISIGTSLESYAAQVTG